MSDIAVQEFAIDSTLELPADFYESSAGSSNLFVNASSSDRVTLKMGLKDPATGAVSDVKHLEDATIDEYELVITPNSMITNIRGRDPMALVLDKIFKKRYRRFPVPVTIEQGEVEDDVTEVVGTFTAKQVATDIVESVGLTLSWEVRDYTLQEDFDAVGRCIDLLKQLVQPWTLVEPFRADIFLQNKVVVIRHRQLPNQLLTAGSDNVFTMLALKRDRMTVRKRLLKPVGKVRLRGRRESQFIDVEVGDKGGLTVIPSGPETNITRTDAFDADGNLLSVVVSEDTYFMPQKLLIKQKKVTYINAPGDITPSGGITEERALASALTLVMRETVTITYENALLGVTGPLNNPKPIQRVVFREVKDADIDSVTFGSIIPLEKDDVGLDYDDKGFLRSETTRHLKLNKDTGRLELDSVVVRSLKDTASLMVQHITERYGFVSGTGMELQSREVQTQGGYRPGGPGRSVFAARTGKDGAENKSWTQIELVETISTEPGAQEFSFSNAHMTADDLEFIMSLFRAADGLFEYEIHMEGVAVPWLHRGVPIRITDLFAEDGTTEISLPTLLVTEIRSQYDESTARAQMTMDVRAFGWRNS